MKIILVISALFLLTCKNVDAQSGVQVYFFGKIISDHQILTVASIKNLSKSLSKHFDSKLRTFVYIPGLAKPFNDEEPQTVIKSLIQLWNNSNIVLIDWSASPTDSVGATLMFKEADIILSNIIGAGLKAESTHVIGFGLGTFIAGYVAQYFKNASLPLARVTGLNPHNLVNAPFMAPYELKRSDATFVDIIHTDEVFGSPTTNGHADFWPNGGKDQAGCFGDALCDHFRAWRYFAESIAIKSSSFKFLSTQCPSNVTIFNSENCNKKSSASMGFFADITTSNRASSVTINYFLTTNAKAPFSLK